MELKRANLYIWIVLALGWLFDFLFWQKLSGISIVLFVLIVLAAGLYLARQQGLTPHKHSLWLLVPIFFFAILTFIRLEPMTRALNVLVVLVLMGLLAHTFLGGQWWQYSFKDYLVGAFSLGVDALIRPLAVFTKQPKPENPEEVRKGKLRTSLAVLRGLLIAFPIVLVFGAMLAEADPIFEQVLGDLLDFFHIENLAEYIVRAVIICIIAYGLLGAYLHAFYKDHDEDLSQEDKRWIPRFLGITEAGIVLGAVNLLFLAFVIVQFRYFFGGQANITLEGYTYAEYARRGFSELATVAFFSLMLFMGLSFITKKAEGMAQGVFSGLGIALVALVSVILVSSFQRLQLYEQAYGFTRLRTYTHVFIFWLGGLLLAVIVLELIKQPRRFALVSLVAAIGFIATLNLLNVDAFIVRQNIAHMDLSIPHTDENGEYQVSEYVDLSYLASLSEDAVPVLSRLYADATDDLQREVLAGAIACHAVLNDHYDYENNDLENYGWQSFHLSRYLAQQDWQERMQSPNADDFDVLYYDDLRQPWNSYVQVNGNKVNCQSYYGWD